MKKRRTRRLTVGMLAGLAVCYGCHHGTEQGRASGPEQAKAAGAVAPVGLEDESRSDGAEPSRFEMRGSQHATEAAEDSLTVESKGLPAPRPAPAPSVSASEEAVQELSTIGTLGLGASRSSMGRGAAAAGGVAHGYGAVSGRALAMKRAASPSEPELDTEAYEPVAETPFARVQDRPLSTFSIDVDTASYSNVRRFLNQGQLPPEGAVRIEELVNYFSYAYPDPSGDEPFAVVTEVSAAPWNPKHRLLHVGLQGKRIDAAKLPPRNLVFLLDVSGSMSSENKLPLLKRSVATLVETLRESDRVAIAVYAGASGLVLEPTAGDQHARILEALDRLEAGGSTNGAGGIQLAYRTARESFRRGGVNRVILATDGDFNVGVTSRSELHQLIEKERESGVFLSVLGFGMGNYKDSTLELLADKGNGNYAYIDSLSEARKVLVEEGGATLVTLAKDVKLQLEFNPAQVAGYRLIGYENRRLAARDFNDDRKDAGELGAGHSVTALYEIVPRGVPVPGPAVDALKYQKPRGAPEGASEGLGDELTTVKLRYKRPNESRSQLLERVVRDAGQSLDAASPALRFSAAVAAFGMTLRDSKERGTASYAMARRLARGALGPDESGYRREFVSLVDRAEALESARGPRARGGF